VFVLSFTGVLNLFDPIYVMRNAHISPSAEVLDTYTYDVGIVQARYPLGTAVGLFKSSISLLMVIGANFLSRRFTEDHRGII
jgi:putative aldouronate transport system permease protein